MALGPRSAPDEQGMPGVDPLEWGPPEGYPAPPGPTDLVLLVAGEPGPPDDLKRMGIRGMAVRIFGWTPPSWMTPGVSLTATSRPPRAPTDVPPPEDVTAWHVERGGIATLQMVAEAALHGRRRVLVVNANAPGPCRDLVAKWFGADDVLPILVRPDGQRLVGQEQFSPASLRRFLGSPR